MIAADSSNEYEVIEVIYKCPKTACGELFLSKFEYAGKEDTFGRGRHEYNIISI